MSEPAIDHTSLTPSPIAVFELRCWARAFLYRAGEYTLHEAVDVLQHDAERNGLIAANGQDAVQQILARHFREPEL